MLSVVGDTFCSNSADAWTALTTLTLPISNCQSNVMFMASLVFFVPAFAFSWRQASMIRIRGLTYTPLLRLANSHTGRFARRYEAPQGWANDHVLLLSLQSVCLACWAVMATAECLFEKSNSGPVSFSRIGVLLGEVLQWTLSILFLNVLRRKQATPSFRFLRSFWSIQFALCLGTGILGVEKIWAPPYGSGAKSVEFFSRWGALVACGVLFFISLYGCLYANFDFSDKTSIVQRMAQHRDDGVGYGPPYPDSPVSKFRTRTPRTISTGTEKHRNTPEKKLWQQFYDGVAEAEADLLVPPTPPRVSDELSSCIRKIYNEYLVCKQVRPHLDVEFYFDEGGTFQVQSKQAVPDNEKVLHGESPVGRHRRTEPMGHGPASPGFVPITKLASESIERNAIVTIPQFEDLMVSFLLSTVNYTLVQKLGFSKIFLFDTTSPIFVSKNWQTAERLVVIIPSSSDRVGGAGVWNMVGCFENGMRYGSVLLLCEQVLEENSAVVILNPVTYHAGMVPHTDVTFSKLILDTKKVLESGDQLTFDHLRDSLISQGYAKDTLREHSRALKSMALFESLSGDDGPTKRVKVAWDTLVSKSRASNIVIASHRQSYNCAVKTSHYAMSSGRLRACVFMDGHREDYNAFRSLQNIHPKFVGDVYSLEEVDDEKQDASVYVKYRGCHRYSDKEVIIHRFSKQHASVLLSSPDVTPSNSPPEQTNMFRSTRKRTNQSLVKSGPSWEEQQRDPSSLWENWDLRRTMEMVHNESRNMLVFMESEEYMWYIMNVEKEADGGALNETEV